MQHHAGLVLQPEARLRANKTGLRLSAAERLNFLLTNRIPRRAATRFMGWFSRCRHPWVCRVSIAVWQWFAGDLRLYEAKKSRFESMQDCFIRELKDGARPITHDPAVLASPCDGVVGAFGPVRGMQAFQVKGLFYDLAELFGDAEAAAAYRDGLFVTLRLKANMYHRFHAPDALRLHGVTYIAGDCWNVNGPAVKRVERLYCKNARAVLAVDLAPAGPPLALVAVAAILVASIKVHGVDGHLQADYRGPRRLPCDRAFARGEEMGYFRQGSTILVFAPAGFAPADKLRSGAVLRMGQPLLRRIPAASHPGNAPAVYRETPYS